MKFIKTKIDNVWVIKHNKLIDNRGIFTRKFCKKSFKKNGFDLNFVQFNQSDNTFKGTLRGMHYQSDPFSEIKLISCINIRMEEQDKTNKPEECQDLKNLQYKTMLLKGKRTLLLPKNTSDDTAGIEKLL